MCTGENRNRKDMDDLKRDIVDTANTSKEITQYNIQNVATEIKSAVDTVDAHVKNVVEKAKDAAADIKQGTMDVARSVRHTAINVARKIPRHTKRTNIIRKKGRLL